MSRYKDKDLTFEITVPANTEHLMLYSDPFWFRQIFSNLLGNAVKYSIKGKISAGYIMVSERNPEWLHFFVKDNGIGIAQKDFQLIFDRFAQAGRVQKVEGAGLGLSITKGLVELLGGAIWLESEINKGSEFNFSLPYDPEVDTAMSEEDSEEGVPKVIQHFDFAGKTLYIAEDDEFSFFFIKEILSDTQITIKHALNGEELLMLISENVPDLVLLDINMPVMNGYTCIRELRIKYPDLPVIAQTAYAMPGEREAILKAGCNAYISKPLDSQELKKMMNGIIG